MAASWWVNSQTLCLQFVIDAARCSKYSTKCPVPYKGPLDLRWPVLSNVGNPDSRDFSQQGGCAVLSCSWSSTLYATVIPWTQYGEGEAWPPGIVARLWHSLASLNARVQGCGQFPQLKGPPRARCFCARFLSWRKRGRVADSYLMAPSFSYSSRILFSDNSSLLVFFFLLREHVSLKLSRENERKKEGNTLLRLRGQVWSTY